MKSNSKNLYVFVHSKLQLAFRSANNLTLCRGAICKNFEKYVKTLSLGEGSAILRHLRIRNGRSVKVIKGCSFFSDELQSHEV